jgi:hypothetical protein
MRVRRQPSPTLSRSVSKDPGPVRRVVVKRIGVSTRSHRHCDSSPRHAFAHSPELLLQGAGKPSGRKRRVNTSALPAAAPIL